METTVLIIIGILVFALLASLFLYNTLIVARTRVEEAWSGIEVQLKRRANLIPNLVEAVKGYVKHEKTVLENVTKARSELVKASSPKDQAVANNMMTDALKSIFAVAEGYPDLKASENFKTLQEELSDTETKISASRNFFNSIVLDFNTKIKVFPNILLAQWFRFQPSEFFDADEASLKDIQVKF
ncbi:MAG: LemA family protein [bacterium]|nr:LemA family protein [bacterium]